MKFRKLLLYIFFIFTTVAVVLFLSRNLILNYLVNKVPEKVKEKYNFTLTIKNASFSGLSAIHIEDIALVPPFGDTLLTIHSIDIKPAYYRILIGKLKYHFLKIDGFSVHLVSDSLSNNFSFKNQKLPETDTVATSMESPRFGYKINKAYSQIFELLAGETTIKNFNVIFESPDNYRRYEIPDFFSNGKSYSCRVFNLSQTDTITWAVGGQIRKQSKGMDFKMVRESSPTSMVQLTGGEKSLKWLVDSLYFETNQAQYANDEMTLALKGGFSNLLINHWRISPEDVSIESGKLDFTVMAGKNFLKVDTISTLSINKFLCKIGFGYETNPGKKYFIKMSTGKIPAPDLFESLPTGMFYTLQGIKTKGEVSYSLNCIIDRNNPDSLIFESELKKYNFSIQKFGNEYLPKMNEDFIYNAYDGDKPMRSFLVGTFNPWFTHLNEISNHLIYSVMTAEDGSFMLHGGFNEEAFRQSIATNIKQGRFARGGSTISMQLVKNVYLSRNKTISRKLEEALIVWLIEKNRIVSKERMLEVYLNIIEWGPNVYGIHEASQFYFSKLPSQLTLAESIFLASIIPHPKFFRYSFDQEGQLKPFLNGFYKLVSERMLRKNWIVQEDIDQLLPTVKLNGPALQLILPADTIPVDSTSTDDIEFIN